MVVFKKILELVEYLAQERKKGKRIGFVPTMGALHEGHISLVNRAKAENAIVVVSIFVNPTQFNNPGDLKKYPRTPSADHQLLSHAGADVVFEPDVHEVYQNGLHEGKSVDLGSLEKVLEGEHRPGHFNGVVQVVSRLFDIVLPDAAYFGEKDFQQLAVIRKMTSMLNYSVEIIGCETKREKNGLAMSSRNLRLSTQEREMASCIYRALQFVKENWQTKGVDVVVKEAIEQINSTEVFKVEYLEIADSDTMQKLNSIEMKNARVFAAVFCGEIRLIDNLAI